MRDRALFGAASIAVSLALFAGEWWLRAKDLYVPASAGFVLPVIAVIACALGVAWQRKVVAIATTLGVLTALDLVGRATGFEWLTMYASTSLIFPIAVLVIFVGMNPSMLWTRVERGPDDRPGLKKKPRDRVR
jgi:hypothetical protein